MPICKRDGFDNAPSKNKDETFHDNEEVFYCEVTKEIFKQYEDYFRHVMAINSTVWQCEATGKDNLTYAEALKSEKRARKKMEMFKDSLRPPVMLVIEHAKQSSLNVLNALTFRFLRKRFFLNEEVQIMEKNKYAPYTVVDIQSPDKKVPANGVYEDTENLLYKLKSLGKSQTEATVPFDKVKRQRFEFTSENLQMFIKNNVVRVDGILRPKPESYQKYVTERKITFDKIFIGKMPHFTPAKIKKPEDAKKQSTLNNYFGKKPENEKSTSKTVSAQEKAKLEKEKAEKSEAKAKSLKEEMERLRRQKEEQLLEQMRQKAEKRAKLMEKIDEECAALLTKTDDLERTDQRLMPTFSPVSTILPAKLVGDAFMLREFMHTFVGILSGIEVFRGNLSFFEMARSFTIREVAGPLSDIILILLGTVMDLQREEEDECSVDYKRGDSPIPFWSHKYVKRHFSFKLNELPLDALTVSEVLRLHILSSGAVVRNKTAEKWRIMYRNGYTSSEDPGIALRAQFPHIVRALKLYTVYQLPFVDIMRILKCLMAQMLTYSGTINLIEERMDQTSSARQELKNLVTAENQRVTKMQTQKRALTNEFNQQCMEEEVKKDAEKRKSLEDKLNKKVAELLAQSEREHKKFQQQVCKLNETLFNFLVYLGMDRAYRKYYVLESMPGIFVEHSSDCMDICLENPPKNKLRSGITANAANLPKNRKELRSYLLKMYTEEEKKSSMASAANKKEKETEAAQEDKENQNQQNGVVNGLTNGHVNGEKMDVDDENASTTSSPTQYELFMCTGEARNCIVHDERNTDRKHWSYLYKKEDLEALIDSLNPLGFRESELREQLTTLKELIQEHIKNCPVDMLSVDSKQSQKFKAQMMNDTYRKYNNSNFGFPIGSTDINEVMYGSLVKRILQFESEIYTGDLGRLKVKDMEKWRKDLHKSCYDPQAKLQWGPPKQNASVTEEENMDEDDDNEGSDIEVDTKDGDDRNYAGKPYRDPGETLGDTLEIDSEDSGDEGISLHDSDTLRSYVKQLASALLQVEQAVERRFLKEPFGVQVIKDKDLMERKQQQAIDRLRQWEVSLMESTSYSQVFLHLNVLYDCIIWARSTNKSNCMVCRRGSDPDKMLLCDECNGGTHMFCMKPKMKTVPEGNWYCKRCVARLGLENEGDKKNKKTQSRKRKFIVDEDNSDASSVTSETKASRGRPSGGGRSKKRLQSQEIEEALEEDDDDDVDQDEELYDEDEVEVEHTLHDIDEEDLQPDENDADNDNEKEQTTESNNQSDVDEDESVCNVCSYDGSELSCTRCKDSFHLECINLKRMPRYNFVCTKCKTKDGNKKRKSRANDSASDNESDDDEDDEPLVKRGRPGRPPSQRNSLANGSVSSTQENVKSNSRRSIRRTADNLPLNSPALYELLEKIMKNEHAWPFLRPVSQSEVPDYYDIIKNPMDFAKVKSKLNMGSYQINEEVMRDIELVFSNCDDYNVKGNEIYQAGSALERHVIDWCKELNLPFKPSDMNTEE
ncbi:bromodomain adjacent to zinc finger domain protein 1A [Lucilia sericata]|uniref:bromodomain adjacent to zinc finger domain protein 1A n=1 Tax=Lucilia sericata TaxID=13632 RepID=UPI0018A81546|nr:bromodomain adjacent to zinc finger domain protein 1A [Lucilia sericata]